MGRFIQRFPDTSLVIVDTLQKVREIGNESYSYTQNERSRDKRTFTLRNRKEVVDIDAIRQEKSGASL